MKNADNQQIATLKSTMSEMLAILAQVNCSLVCLSAFLFSLKIKLPGIQVIFTCLLFASLFKMFDVVLNYNNIIINNSNLNRFKHNIIKGTFNIQEGFLPKELTLEILA